jgi:GNAT superfamily N-acetyltransferase
MYWRVARSTFHAQYGERLKQAMHDLVAAGHVPGILAYRENEPVGWCSIAPRGEFAVLNRSRTLKPVDDQPVWSITCFFISQPYRQHGLTAKLVTAALDYAASQGARIVEAYPLSSELYQPEAFFDEYMGQRSTFEKAGFREVLRRSERRIILRKEIQSAA